MAAVISMGSFAFTSDVNAEIIRDSHVTDTVTQVSADTWHYEFTVHNDSTGFGELGEIGVIIDWELPYFEDMGITNVNSPLGWDYAIETIGVANPNTGWDGTAAWNDPFDPWYQQLDGANNPIFNATQVLHWYCVDPFVVSGDGVFGGCFGGEVGIDSIILPGESLAGFSFDAAYGPTQAPYQTSWWELPVNTGDPSFPSGVTVASPSAIGQVPEPSSIALMTLGMMGLFSVANTRRRKINIKS